MTKKVNLDDAFEKFREENEEHLKEKFLDTHDFYSYLEECWREFQDEKNLFDESNEGDLTEEETKYGEEKDEESEGEHLDTP